MWAISWSSSHPFSVTFGVAASRLSIAAEGTMSAVGVKALFQVLGGASVVTWTASGQAVAAVGEGVDPAVAERRSVRTGWPVMLTVVAVVGPVVVES